MAGWCRSRGSEVKVEEEKNFNHRPQYLSIKLHYIYIYIYIYIYVYIKVEKIHSKIWWIYYESWHWMFRL